MSEQVHAIFKGLDGLVQTTYATNRNSVIIFLSTKDAGDHVIGGVSTLAELPTTNVHYGDIYHVVAQKGDYVWNGYEWKSIQAVTGDDITVSQHTLNVARTADISVSNHTLTIGNSDVHIYNHQLVES